MLTGSCLCGGVHYEAQGPVSAVVRCHCVQCRKASGAEFATNGSVWVLEKPSWSAITDALPHR